VSTQEGEGLSSSYCETGKERVCAGLGRGRGRAVGEAKGRGNSSKWPEGKTDKTFYGKEWGFRGKGVSFRGISPSTGARIS